MEINKPLPLRPGPQNITEQETKLREAADTYEQHFLREMVKAMRKTVTPGIEKPSFAEGIYKEQLDSQYVEAWEHKGGIGLGEMIYQQLHDRFFPTAPKGAFPLKGPLPTQGPLPMEVKGRTTGQKIDMSFRSSSPEQQPLTSPWSGRVLHAETQPNGETSLLIDHPELNVQSRFSYQGITALQNGDFLNAGDNIGSLVGSLGSGGKPLFWSVS
jgi:flagellar protein FlgJ